MTNSLTLASPYWLLALAFPIARVMILLSDRRSRLGAFEFSSLSLVPSRPTFATRFLYLPFFLEIFGWTLLVFALARPQRVVRSVDERLGIDIVIALDSSGSMAAEDFRPRNRFTVAKELVGEFIAKRSNDRIGLVTFGARAATRVPVTLDREIARMALAASQIGENGDGTAIGHAIATAVNRLRNSKARSRVIVLLTDGVHNAGSIEPSTAASLASQLGIRIYSIGIGTEGMVPVPVRMQDPVTGEIETVYQMIRADIDEKMLRAVASATRGQYFRASTPRALESVLTTVDQLEKSRLASPRVTSVEELYGRLLIAGSLLIALSLLMGESLWMRLPA